MAEKRITALAVAAGLADTDSFVVDRPAGTGRVSVAEARTAIVNGADLPSETVVAGFDELADPRLSAWSYTASNGGLLRQSPSAAGAGFPGSGVAGLKVPVTAGSSITAYRLLGLVLDPVVPIVVDVRWNAAIDAEDECQWVLGLADALDTSAVLLLALWDAGTSTRSYALAISTGGVPAITPITLPALTGTGYQGRFTILPGSVVFECSGTDSADDLAVVETIAATVPEAAYHLIMQAERATGAGNRMLLVDWWRWRAKRLADAAPVADLFSGVTAPLLADGSVPLTGPLTTSSTIDGRNVAADGTKLDGIATGAVADHGALTGLADDDHTQYVRVDGTRGSAPVAPTTEATTTRTLTDADHGKVILCTHASGCAVTVPHTLSPGFVCTLVQRGAAQVTATGSGGLTVTPAATFNATTAEIGSAMTIIVESATVANAIGDLDPV